MSGVVPDWTNASIGQRPLTLRLNSRIDQVTVSVKIRVQVTLKTRVPIRVKVRVRGTVRVKARVRGTVRVKARVMVKVGATR